MLQQANNCIHERRCNFRLRRLIGCAYGLSLLCSAAHAAPGDASAELDRALRQDLQPVEIRQEAHSPRLVFLGIDAWGASIDDLKDFLRSPLDAQDPVRSSFLESVEHLRLDQLRFKKHPIRAVKNGLGFDYYLPTGGALHFNLYQRHNRRHDGVRVALNPVDNAAALGRHRNWSVGLSTDFVRTVDGDREIALKPQVLLDLDGLLHMRRAKVDACVEYGHWYGGQSKAVADVQVAQASIRVRF